MIEVRTEFNPFRMKVSRKEPVVLSVQLANTGNEQEMVSLDLNLGKQFSLERSGYRTVASEKIMQFKPGESRKYYFDIWPKQVLSGGDQAIALTVTEHYNGLNYVKRKHEKKLLLGVDE